MVNSGIKHRKSPTHKKAGNGFYNTYESGSLKIPKILLITKIFCNFFMRKKGICFKKKDENM